jgi:hypothetical protein
MLNGCHSKAVQLRQSWQQRKVGDVLATAEGEAKPLVAPFDGVVEIAEDTLVLRRTQAPVRYEIPGTTQLVVGPATTSRRVIA